MCASYFILGMFEGRMCTSYSILGMSGAGLESANTHVQLCHVDVIVQQPSHIFQKVSVVYVQGKATGDKSMKPKQTNMYTVIMWVWINTY